MKTLGKLLGHTFQSLTELVCDGLDSHEAVTRLFRQMESVPSDLSAPGTFEAHILFIPCMLYSAEKAYSMD